MKETKGPLFVQAQTINNIQDHMFLRPTGAGHDEQGVPLPQQLKPEVTPQKQANYDFELIEEIGRG